MWKELVLLKCPLKKKPNIRVGTCLKENHKTHSHIENITNTRISWKTNSEFCIYFHSIFRTSFALEHIYLTLRRQDPSTPKTSASCIFSFYLTPPICVLQVMWSIVMWKIVFYIATLLIPFDSKVLLVGLQLKMPSLVGEIVLCAKRCNCAIVKLFSNTTAAFIL